MIITSVDLANWKVCTRISSYASFVTQIKWLHVIYVLPHNGILLTFPAHMLLKNCNRKPAALSSSVILGKSDTWGTMQGSSQSGNVCRAVCLSHEECARCLRSDCPWQDRLPSCWAGLSFPPESCLSLSWSWSLILKLKSWSSCTLNLRIAWALRAPNV